MFETNRRISNEYDLLPDQTYQELQNGIEEDNVFKIFGYTKCRKKLFLYHLFGVLTLGLFYMILSCLPKLRIHLKYQRCPLRNATILLVCDNHGNTAVKNVIIEQLVVPQLGPTNLKYFEHQHTKYVFVDETDEFDALENIIKPLTLDQYLENTAGLTNIEYRERLELYGRNNIEVEVKSYWRLFIEEIFTPFYLFQGFSVLLWLCDDYVIYAVCVIVLTLFSSFTSLIQIRKQSQALHDLVERSKCYEVKVFRRMGLDMSSIVTIDPSELVPDDLVVLPAANFIMPCDAVIITGHCIVNESVLTGESVPITKTAPYSSNELFDTAKHKRHTLFAGTNVLQTRYYGGKHVLARVVRTGFNTTKGALVKSIMYPTPVNLQFYKDSLKFIVVLFLIALSGMIFCLYLYVDRGAELKEILVRTLDIITIVVPPALPAALAVGTAYSQERLKKLGIFCVSPPRINVCGKVKLACFDKTGTLTHDGLDMNSVVPCSDSVFAHPVTNTRELDIRSRLVQAMATCHSLTTIDGTLNGDPLDLIMFQFTEWYLEEPGDSENTRYDLLAPVVVMPEKIAKVSSDPLVDLGNELVPYQIGIVRQFPFSSTVQCMSVICRNLLSRNMIVFTKGAPEKIQTMCLSHTLPNDFADKLGQYTVQGFRVIAVAFKELPAKFKWKDAQKAKRDVIECELNFLGLLIMKNALKEETTPVIRTLHNANIRTVMITGDNTLTAISVARECGMVGANDEIFVLNFDEENKNVGIENTPRVDVDSPLVNLENKYHLAVDGKTWHNLRTYRPDIIPKLLIRGSIFARFQPDQKTQLVTQLQSLGYVVSMVGDGANDCGALKAAHVGVSLSQEEASVAAPFTSSIPNILCIVKLILEGRCALVTSFAIFKYMALYSLIQFCTILILYKNHSILGDYQFLFIDLVITTCLAVTMGRQGPSKQLCAQRPTSSLVAAKTLVPILLQIATCAFIQLAALFFLFHQKWFEPIPPHSHDEVILSWENTVLFTVSCFQYIILATVFSKGRPYRQMLITNVWFLICAVLLTVFTAWLLIYPCREMARVMEVIEFKHTHLMFRLELMVFPMLHLVLAVFIESGMGDRQWWKRFIQLMRCKTVPKNKYKVLINDDKFEDCIEYLRHNNSHCVRVA